MLRYEEYRYSGVEWIKEIPKHWNVNSVKREFSFETGFTPPTEHSGYYEDGDQIWVNIGDMNSRVISDSESKITAKAVRALRKRVVPIGSLLYSFKLSVGKVGFAGVDCYTNEAIFSILPDSRINLSYFYYSLPSQILSNANENIYGAKILNQELIKNAKLLIPPPAEQTAIANFLDRKTALLDRAVAQQERLIELLRERKQIVIQRAVTRGLDAGVAMKDSGVAWVGEIPEHWKITQIRKLTTTTSGSTPRSGSVDRYYNGSIPWVRTMDLNNSELRDTPEKITAIAVRETSCKLIPKNSVCVAMYGGGGTIGKHALLKFNGTLNQAVCGILPSNKLNSRYLYYYVKFYRPHWMIVAKGSRVDPNINQEEVGKMFIPSFSIDEQNEIAEFLDYEIAKLHSAMKIKIDQITKLKEYRATLIDAAVTGKVRVG